MLVEKRYHIQMKRGDVGRYVFLPGDPGRCRQIASYLDHPKQIAYNREYNTYTGELNEEKVSVMSTGIGGPSTAIGVEELYDIGADTFIRIGTCGGMQADVIPGSVVIATGAIRAEGTSREYLPIEFPAVADYTVTRALVESAVALRTTHHVGVVQCKDSYYGQHAPDRQPISGELLARWMAWIRGGCLASEMESAALFIIASSLKARAGTVLLVAGNLERNKMGIHDDHSYDVAPAIEVAIDAIKKLIALDRNKQ